MQNNAFFSAASVFIGAGIGAVLRWQLSLYLNKQGAFPVGTLAANWLGGLCIGLIAGYVSYYPNISPQWRLFLVTGLLGGLTTFSTFSAEAVSYLHNAQWNNFLTHTSLHLLGSIALTVLGFWIAAQLNN